MSVRGDVQSEDFSFWMLQFRPCLDYAQYMAQFTDAQRNWWEDNRLQSTSAEQTRFSNKCIQDEELVKSWLQNHQLTLFANTTFLNGESVTEGYEKEIYTDEITTLFKATLGR